MATSPIGMQEDMLRQLMTSILGARGKSAGSPIPNQLYRSAIGRPTQQQNQMFNRGLRNDRADIIESFGSQGARYGSDLGNALGRQSSDARLGFQNMLQERSMNALNQILNLGGTTSGFEFQRGESALERALKQYIEQLRAQTALAGILPQFLQ